MPSSVLINIFISTEDGITEKLLLFKIKFVVFTGYWLSWYGEFINIFNLFTTKFHI